MSFPVFSILDVAVWLPVVLLYAYTIIRFFKSRPIKNTQADEINTSEEFGDPLYKNRLPLKALLIYFLSSLVFMNLAPIIINFLELIHLPEIQSTAFHSIFNGEITKFTQFDSVMKHSIDLADAVFFGVASLIGQGTIILYLYKSIPKRAIDVVYLRGFSIDKANWRIVRNLRKAAPGIRLSGVRDPFEKKRLSSFFFWMVFPFILSLGDYTRVNAFRHNVFLGGDWKAGIRRIFPAVKAVVFDCRNVTPNLTWEINEGMAALAADRCFFLFPEGAPPAKALQAPLKSGGGLKIRKKVPPENCFTDNMVSALGEKLTRCALP